MKKIAAMMGTLLLSCTWGALADGGFFPEFAGSADSADQRAAIVYEQGRETVILQTAREEGEGGFAWVIPTPTQAKQADITEGDPRLFDELFWLTEPRSYHYGGGVLTGCSGDSDGREEQYAGVNVWEQFVVSDYEVAVLSAEDSGNLGKWLTDNGYGVPESAGDLLGHYVAKDWFFIALKIDSPPRGDIGPVPPDPGEGYGPSGGLGPGDGGQGEEFKPLQISFDTPQIVFPMRISAVSSRDEVSVLLYVFAQHRVEGANYPTTQVQAGADWPGGDFADYYEGKFQQALATVAPSGLVTEYAGKVGEWWIKSHQDMLPLNPSGKYFLTRLRTYLGPEDMQDDIVLTAAASDDEFSVMLASADPATSPLRLVMSGLLLLGIVLSGRRRGKGWELKRALFGGLLVLVLLV